MPLEASTSPVWKYFGFPSKDGQIIEQDKRKEVRCIASYMYVPISLNTVGTLQIYDFT